PQCPKNEFWATRVESLYTFTKQLIEYYGADEDRVTLTGLSMGGFGTWFFAMAHPELFAAIAPVCGGGMAWSASKLTMPVWAFHGDQDQVVRFVHSAEMVEALEKLGRDVKFTVFKGEGHAIQKLSFTEELLCWLISKKK
ncbi:MAG: prolyl oligopeptidase family serine peptidase, partial [Oscillospiraceae bacterium]|nr:prolyl oligopeptidase family serine peptidase [Oscillospiraceae bacterium]